MPNEPTRPPAPGRLASLDAYRGFIMLLMASSGFQLYKVVAAHPELPRESACWRFFAYQLDHVTWTGCSLWDLIQPSFMFMVGVAIPYSYASRKAKGDSEGRIFSHVLLRALILIALGVFLSSNYDRHTNVTLVNVLSQIGLGYVFVYLLRGRGLVLQLAALLVILGGYWYLFYQYPTPGPDFDFKAVKATEAERFSGLYAHWDKNANFASDCDKTFLNFFRRREPVRFHFAGREWASEILFRPEPFKFNAGGYATLNFVPSMATMIFGLMAGELLRGGRRAGTKFVVLVLAGVVCLVIGLVTDYTIWPEKITLPVNTEGGAVGLFHVCPVVKKIWTPTWAVFSAGWTFLMLAGFFGVMDLAGYRRWAFPLTVVGMNSIAMYCMSQLLRPWLRSTWKIHFGQNIFDGMYGPIVEATAILLALWLICLWLYRQKIFVRI